MPGTVVPQVVGRAFRPARARMGQGHTWALLNARAVCMRGIGMACGACAAMQRGTRPVLIPRTQHAWTSKHANVHACSMHPPTWRTVRLVSPSSDAVASGASSDALLTLSRVRWRVRDQRSRARLSSLAEKPQAGLATTSTLDLQASTCARMALHTPRIAFLLAPSSRGHSCSVQISRDKFRARRGAA
jgi:hypothetical protein